MGRVVCRGTTPPTTPMPTTPNMLFFDLHPPKHRLVPAQGSIMPILCHTQKNYAHKLCLMPRPIMWHFSRLKFDL